MNPMVHHITAALAEQRRCMVSDRTKAGLAAAKARGVKLGGDRGYRPTTHPDGRLGGIAVRLEADRAAARVAVVIAEVRAKMGAGISLERIARELTAREVATPRGGAWTATAVRRVLLRVPARNIGATVDDG